MITTENIKNLLKTIIEYHEDEARRLRDESPNITLSIENKIRLNTCKAKAFRDCYIMLTDNAYFQSLKAEYQEKKKKQAARDLSK